MNLHEYQAKALLQKYNIPVPRGQVISLAKQTSAATSEIASNAWVVKAQVHAGGRGKAGGVKVVKSPKEAQQVASELLGKTLVTYQNLLSKYRELQVKYKSCDKIFDVLMVLFHLNTKTYLDLHLQLLLAF